MSDIKFVENNPEKILQETIANYESIAGYSVSPADVERILADLMAYRETLLRAEMERVVRQNFIQTATFTALDYWGELFGVTRLINKGASGNTIAEDDDSYRARILANTASTSKGTKFAYITKIKTNNDVGDVTLFSKNDDSRIPPGRIKIVLIQKQTTNNIVSGKVAAQSLKQTIFNLISNKDNSLIGDVFTFDDAVPVTISGTITAERRVGVTIGQATQDLQTAVDMFFGNLSLSFDSVFASVDLQVQLKNVGSISSVKVVFPNIPPLEVKQFYVKGNLTINVT